MHNKSQHRQWRTCYQWQVQLQQDVGAASTEYQWWSSRLLCMYDDKVCRNAVVA